MARGNIKVIGIGKRMQGTAQSGNPYDFIPVYFAFKEQDCQGFCTDIVVFDPPEFPVDCTPGIEYDSVYHFQKDRMYINATPF